MGQTDKSEAAMAAAEQQLAALPGKLSPEVALEVAQSMLALGKTDKACDLMRDLIKNNHENATILRQVGSMFDQADLGAEGNSLIKESQQEVVAINNEGVMLAKKGEFLEGAKLLRTAVQNLPNSEVVIMNLCGMLIGQMRKEGKTDALTHEIKGLLERVGQLNPANKKYRLYLDAINRGK
jgi:predicted Zn-dependent protease